MKLSDTARSILNDGEHIERQADWFKKLEDLFNGKSNSFLDEYVFVLDGIAGQSKIDLYSEPEEWVIDCLENLALRIDETKKENVFVPSCIEYPPFGVHFVDKMFGAPVFFKDNQWWCDYLTSPIGQLEIPDLDKDETWALAKRATRAFLDQGVKLPLFGLPTIASALNIIVNLYGQDFLLAMLEDPISAKHDLKVINDLLCKIHQWYRGVLIPEILQPVISWNRTQPYGYGQICGCTTALISGDFYKEFIAPLDTELLGVYPHGGMVHLCGSHLQHIETFRDMKELRAFQINDRAAHDLEDYYNDLREDQIIYLNPCDGMTIEKAVKITGGHRLVIAGTGGKAVKRPLTGRQDKISDRICQTLQAPAPSITCPSWPKRL